MWAAIITGIIVIALALLALKLSAAKAPAYASSILSCPILSDNENEFFHRLLRALPEYHVFPQVAANALLQVDKAIEYKKRGAIRNRFAQWHVDFVVCKRDSLDVVGIIELDDRTHKKEKDHKRDALFAGAGYTTHRFDSRKKPSEAEIAALFTQATPMLKEARVEQF